MTEDYEIVYVDKPEQSAWGIIGRALSAFNAEQAGDEHSQRLCYVVQGPDRAIAGGIIGVVYWDWLSVELLWLKEELRGRGYGHRLLALVEDAARQHGARHAHLDTFSFQAPEFYRQHGYEVFGELADFPPGYQRTYMKKEL
jgi:GNAT superfamily N-acetyltransferase